MSERTEFSLWQIVVSMTLLVLMLSLEIILVSKAHEVGWRSSRIRNLSIAMQVLAVMPMAILVPKIVQSFKQRLYSHQKGANEG